MTTPDGVRIIISTASLQSNAPPASTHVEPKDSRKHVSYYLHPSGLKAKTRDADEGLVYEAFGYRPVSLEQFRAAQQDSAREDAQYECEAKKMIVRYEAGQRKGKQPKRKPQPAAVHIEPKDDAKTSEQIKAELEKRISKKKRGARVGVPKRRKAREMGGREFARF